MTDQIKGNLEINIRNQPYHGKQVVPPPPYQDGHNCFLESCSTCTESQYKRRGALQDPHEDFEVLLSRPDFKDLYEKKHGPISGEKEVHTGFTEVKNSLEILEKEGVPGFKGKERVGIFKIASFHEKDPVHVSKPSKSHLVSERKLPQDIQKLLRLAHVMVGTFKISKNYFTLKPGDIYVYDRDDPEIIDGKYCSHAVAIIGYSRRDGVWYYVFQNSYGEGWGEKGVGRVAMDSLRHLVQVKI